MIEGERVNKLFSYRRMLWTKEVIGKVKHVGSYFMHGTTGSCHISKKHGAVTEKMGL